MYRLIVIKIPKSGRLILDNNENMNHLLTEQLKRIGQIARRSISNAISTCKEKELINTEKCAWLISISELCDNIRNGTISGYTMISINCPSVLTLSSIKENIVNITDNPSKKNTVNIAKFGNLLKNKPLEINRNVTNTTRLIKMLRIKANKIFDKQKSDISIGALIRIKSPLGEISCLEIR
tara:strand:+ start:665 stop:1207 length:543 start_codon:yes stop_codon:yes gene_type:complete